VSGYLLTILTLVAIAAMLGLALNLQWGSCGLINFGLVGFYAVGAYACALAAKTTGSTFAGACAAIAVTAVASGLMAVISTRLSEDYLAIVTIGFAEITRLVLLNEAWLTGGAHGFPGIPRPFASVVSPDHYDAFLLGLVVASLVGVWRLLERLARSPFGRLVRAVREDDVVAATLGKNILSVRVRVFMIGGAIVGLAGAFHAFHFTYIDPTQFTSIVTANAFMAVIAGGRGSNRGLVLGAVTVMLLIETTRYLKDFLPWLDASQVAAVRLILIGLGLILLLIYRPGGLLPEFRLSSAALRPAPH
jgi:ABC-type branched-subunit amino acid transport system permease subunit